MPSQPRVMLTSLLVRLLMVALTMTAVCWIGWTVPASPPPETSLASGPIEQGREPIVSLPAVTTQPAPLPEQRERKWSRPSATTLDVNHATKEDLQRLPGIGPVLAGRIIEYREVRGAFRNLEQLRLVKGIGKKTFERIRLYLGVAPPSVSRPARKTA